jgi:hypothetical protein
MKIIHFKSKIIWTSKAIQTANFKKMIKMKNITISRKMMKILNNTKFCKEISKKINRDFRPQGN